MSGLEVAPISEVIVEGNVTLDEVSQDANVQEANMQSIVDSREMALDFLTKVELKGARVEQADAFGSITQSNASASELSGTSGDKYDLTPEQMRTVDMVNDLYIATAKFGAAWKVVDGIGKDTKTMLQTQ